MSSVARKEPAPLLRPGQPWVQDLVIADIRGVDPNSRVIDDLEDRKRYGIKKYGTGLKAHNGRNAAMDAYQEALDLVVYLRQCLEEGIRVEAAYDATLGMLAWLRPLAYR